MTHGIPERAQTDHAYYFSCGSCASMPYALTSLSCTNELTFFLNARMRLEFSASCRPSASLALYSAFLLGDSRSSEARDWSFSFVKLKLAASKFMPARAGMNLSSYMEQNLSAACVNVHLSEQWQKTQLSDLRLLLLVAAQACLGGRFALV